MILYVYLATCVAIDPGTAASRCAPIQQQEFMTQIACASEAREILKDKTKVAVCVAK